MITKKQTFALASILTICIVVGFSHRPALYAGTLDAKNRSVYLPEDLSPFFERRPGVIPTVIGWVVGEKIRLQNELEKKQEALDMAGNSIIEPSIAILKLLDKEIQSLKSNIEYANKLIEELRARNTGEQQ